MIIFLAITFGLSWTLAALYWAASASGVWNTEGASWGGLLLIGVWAPNIAAIAAVYKEEGRNGLLDLLSRLQRWRVGWFWWSAAVFLPFGLWNLAILCANLVADVSFGRWVPSSGSALLLFLGTNLIAGPMGEELGWRGFALSRLLARMRALPASLLIGAVWAVWHLPAFFFPHVKGQLLPNVGFLPFLVYVLSASVLASWITLNARQSVLPAMAFHFMLLVAIIAVKEDPVPALVWSGAACFAFAAIIVACWDPDLGAGPTRQNLTRRME